MNFNMLYFILARKVPLYRVTESAGVCTTD